MPSTSSVTPMRLPTAKEINPFDDLDGKRAERNFLGKTLDEAEAVFRKASLVYQEDLMFMGPIGFRFYVHAGIAYIRSDAATNDADIINCFATILDHRLGFEPEELTPVAPSLASTCRYILEHYDTFGIIPEIYGDLRPRYRALEQTFLRQAQA